MSNKKKCLLSEPEVVVGVVEVADSVLQHPIGAAPRHRRRRHPDRFDQLAPALLRLDENELQRHDQPVDRLDGARAKAQRDELLRFFVGTFRRSAGHVQVQESEENERRRSGDEGSVED